jgi:hypothetical protein
LLLNVAVEVQVEMITTKCPRKLEAIWDLINTDELPLYIGYIEG